MANGFPWQTLSRQELTVQIEDQLESLGAHLLHWLGDHPRDRARWHGVLSGIDHRHESSLQTVARLRQMLRAFRGESRQRPPHARDRVFQSRLEIIESELANLGILLQYLHRS